MQIVLSGSNIIPFFSGIKKKKKSKRWLMKGVVNMLSFKFNFGNVHFR